MTKYEKDIITLSKIITQNYEIKNSRNLKKIIQNKPINILIDSIENINDFNVLNYFLFCSIKIRLGEIFIALSYENKLNIIKSANNKLIKDIFDDIEIDDVYELVSELPKEEFKKILLAISSDVRRKLISLSKYDEGEVGSIMNTSFIKLNGDLSISKAVKIIEENKDFIKLDSVIFIVDLEEKLIGELNIYDILLEKSRSIKLNKIMNKNFVLINNHEDIETLVNLFKKYELGIIPVVNNENVLLGFVNDNDVISLIDEEVTEDIYKMYGINELDKPYIRTKIFDIVKSRTPWLILLMLASTITSIVLQSLQMWGDELITTGASTLILVPIIPVISGTSGNAGSQSAVTIIRGISIGEITIKDYKKILWKEFLVALWIGLILAIFNFVRLAIYYSIDSPFPSETNVGIHGSLIISVAVSFSLFIAIVISKIIGCLLPLLAIKIKIDPASMASPLLTTLIDTITISILFLIGIGIISLII